MEDRTYSSLSRHGLASSNSLLDGVPFKIGLNFIQPPKIIAAPEFCRPNLSKVINVEYAFETEEAVLAWAQAREEALKQAALEESERVAEKHRKQVDGAGSAADVEVDNESYVESDTSCPDQNGENVYDVPRKTVSSLQDHASNKEKPSVPPKPAAAIKQQMPEPNTILKPTPIHSTPSAAVLRKAVASTDNKISDTNSVFDVSMFESESDPFDSLELQTLNDMEELKILLDSSTRSSADNTSAQVILGNPQSSSDTDDNTGHVEDSATEIIYDMATVVNDNAWVTFSDDTPLQSTGIKQNDELSDKRGKTPSPTVGCLSTDGTSGQSREDGEYVEITSNYKKQTIKFQNHVVNGVSSSSNSESLAVTNNSTTVFGGNLPANLANSKIYKPVLLPFKPGSTDNDNSNTSTNPFSQTATQVQSTNPFLSHTAQDTKNPFLQNTHDRWSSFSQSLDVENGDIPGEQKDFPQIPTSVPTAVSKTSLLIPPPPASKPSRNRQNVPNSRMWSSVGPSLATSVDESINSDHVPYNPYSRHSLSSSDLHLSSSCSDIGEIKSKSPVFQKPSASQSSFQIWNRHRPLPPIPSPTPSITHTPHSTPESYKVTHLPSSQPVGLTDPYYSLSQEAQMFTNSLTSMGFLRARVARAVAKFGQDEKEVLDHLIAVDTLVEKKYAPVLVESTLIIFKNNVEKAEEFLKMLTQFEELGFKSDKIQEALISTNMDYDKVLDILTT